MTIDSLEKSSTVNRASYGQLLRLNSPYLLNNPLIYLCMFINFDDLQINLENIREIFMNNIFFPSWVNY